MLLSKTLQFKPSTVQDHSCSSSGNTNPTQNCGLDLGTQVSVAEITLQQMLQQSSDKPTHLLPGHL